MTRQRKLSPERKAFISSLIVNGSVYFMRHSLFTIYDYSALVDVRINCISAIINKYCRYAKGICF